MEKSVGQKPSVSCPRCILLSVTPLKLSARGVYRVCVCSCETIEPSHFPTLQMAAILLISMHCSPGNWRQVCIEDRNMYSCLFVPIALEEHWLKLLPPQGAIHQGFTWALKKPQSWRSLTALSSNVKQRITSNGWQNLDEKRIFYSWLSTKGRSETLGMGGTCRNLDPEPWTWCLFHLGPYAGV